MASRALHPHVVLETRTRDNKDNPASATDLARTGLGLSLNLISAQLSMRHDY